MIIRVRHHGTGFQVCVLCFAWDDPSMGGVKAWSGRLALRFRCGLSEVFREKSVRVQTEN